MENLESDSTNSWKTYSSASLDNQLWLSLLFWMECISTSLHKALCINQWSYPDLNKLVHGRQYKIWIYSLKATISLSLTLKILLKSFFTSNTSSNVINISLWHLSDKGQYKWTIANAIFCGVNLSAVQCRLHIIFRWSVQVNHWPITVAYIWKA